MKQKKKQKKSLILVLIFISLLTGLLILKFANTGAAAYDEEAAQEGDISTYYSFSGNIESKNKQTIIADGMMQIKDIQVEEGKHVSEDEVLFKNSQGQKTKSKISGEVSKIFVEENQSVMAGGEIMEITDYNNLKVTIKIDEYDIASVTEGESVIVRVNALSKEVDGIISKISKEAVNTNGISYFTADIDLKDSTGLLVGMTTEIKLLNESVQGVTTISMKSLQFNSDNSPFVYIKGNDGKPVKQPVTLGINDGTRVEIKGGLSTGDTILIPKSFNQIPMGFERNREEDGER